MGFLKIFIRERGRAWVERYFFTEIRVFLREGKGRLSRYAMSVKFLIFLSFSSLGATRRLPTVFTARNQTDSENFVLRTKKLSPTVG